MRLTRGWALLLVGAGVWNWVIWPRFAVAIWNDPRSWSAGQVGSAVQAGRGGPTGFLIVHAVLIAASLIIGTLVGVLGVRAWRAARTAGQD